MVADLHSVGHQQKSIRPPISEIALLAALNRGVRIGLSNADESSFRRISCHRRAAPSRATVFDKITQYVRSAHKATLF